MSYGTSISGVTDTPKTWGLTAGANEVAEALARRFTTANGSLFYDLGYGVDVRQALNGPITEATKRQIAGQLEDQALQDERIESVQITVEPTSPSAIKITVAAVLVDQSSFTLILGVNSLTVDLLSVAT